MPRQMHVINGLVDDSKPLLLSIYNFGFFTLGIVYLFINILPDSLVPNLSLSANFSVF